MKEVNTVPNVIILWKCLLTVIFALHMSFSQRLFAQCQGFFVTVDTDPPYLTYCPGDTVLAFPIITGGTGPFTYQWTTGGTDSIEVLVALENGWYTTCLTVTDANGCVAYGCKHIKPTYYDLYISENGPQCLGESVQLQVSVGPPNTFLWSTGETSNPIYVTEPGTYSVTVTDPVNGCVQELEVFAEFYPLPTPEISGPTEICDGLTATLEVVDALQYYNFYWSPFGEVTSTIEITDSGTYGVTVTDINGCAGTAEYVVEHLVGTLPALDAPPYLCPEDVGIIEVTNAGDLVSFIWSTGETTSSISGTAPETFSVTVTDINGCIESGEISIALFEVTDPVILGDAEMCVDQETVTITVDQSFAQYQWSTGEVTQSIVVSESGMYHVTVTDVNGCSTTGLHEIIAAPIPEPFIQLPPITCDSLPALLQVLGTGGPYVSYLWSPTGETTSEIVAFETGTFSVWVANAYGCTGTSFEETVVIGNGPDAGISVMPLNCNEAAILTASGEGYYDWSTGETSQSITIVNSGTYSLTVSDDNDCSDTAEVTVSISGVLEVEVLGPPSICEGESVTLNVSATFDSYLWSGGETTAEISVSQPGTYAVTVSDASGCTGVGSLTISAAPLPEPEIFGPDGFCNGDTVTLALNDAFVTILWSNGSTTQSINVTEPNLYSVVVTNASGCTGVDEWAIGTFPETEVNIVGPASICNGSSTTLAVAGAFTSIAWSTGEISPEIVINGSGTYSVVVTDSNGCTAADIHIVESGDSLSPVITVTGPPCADSIMLDAGSGYTNYLWSNSSTTSSIIVTVTGNYSVTVSDASGCSGSRDTIVSMSDPPQINISGPVGVCAGDSGILTVSPGFTSYVWSNGATTDSIIVTESGNYSVLVTDTNGCTATANASFESFPTPVVDILGPASMCTGNSTTLSVSGSFSEVAWSTGETTPGIIVSGSGTYQVVVTDSNGCTATDVHLMEIADSLSPVITVSGPMCDGQAILDVGVGYNAYVWSNGSTTSAITVTASGNYAVTVSDLGGCTGQDIINITIPVPPQVSITGPPAACEGNPGTLIASLGFLSYAWSTGETTESITVSSTGDYVVVVTDTNGCTATASHAFEEFPLPTVEITGPGFMCNGDITSLNISGSFAQITWSTGETGNSISVTQGGLYAILVTDANGCTATSELVVTELQTDYTFEQIEACSVQDTGTVEVVLINQYGCDSIVTINTVLTPTLSTDISMSACMGESVIFNGVEIAAGTSQQFIYTASNGCDSLVTVTVAELPPVDFDLRATATCPNVSDGTIEISVHHETPPLCLFALNGSVPQTDSVFSNLPGGKYSVLVLDHNGCTYDATIEVPESTLAEVVVEDQELGCDEPMAVLEPTVMAGNIAEIKWQWSNGSTQPWIEVNSPGRYSVMVDDGCTEQKFTINVDWAAELQKENFFFVPNVFSPNNDGINEQLQVFPGPDLIIRNFEFRIFDRWGNLMFGTNNIEDSWDGIFRGSHMEPGVYVWYIKGEVDVCGMRDFNVLNKGDVTIVR